MSFDFGSILGVVEQAAINVGADISKVPPATVAGIISSLISIGEAAVKNEGVIQATVVSIVPDVEAIWKLIMGAVPTDADIAAARAETATTLSDLDIEAAKSE